MPPSNRASKLCATCGRSFSRGRRHDVNWDEVRYCSERCRRHKPTDADRAIEQQILAKLQANSGALDLGELTMEMFEASWREQKERVRQAARRLVARDAVEFIQDGRSVDPSTARGAIHLRLSSRT